MRALVWHGKEDVRCDQVPDPKIEDPRDMIVKITATAICGSDLHPDDVSSLCLSRPPAGAGGFASANFIPAATQ
jgi:hypothetical protein